MGPEALQQISLAYVESLQNPSAQTFQIERDLHTRWSFLREIEECFFRQKSCINWLVEGDINTTYFFRICQTRASYNAIRSFILLSGEVISDPIAMRDHAGNHFFSILGQRSQATNSLCLNPDWFNALSHFRVAPALLQNMTVIPTGEEIRKLFFKLNPNKASGPDGLTSAFFKASWDILGEEVIVSVKHFFSHCFLPATANSTILTLSVPKKKGRLVGLGRRTRSVPPSSAPPPFVDPEVLTAQLKDKDDRISLLETQMAAQQAGYEAQRRLNQQMMEMKQRMYPNEVFPDVPDP
ncbi:hypothetical protein F2Q69_00021427 [Brassica cretica]|uniref:Reverse transcriptase domain-containing protein n=1 Tax=Brassica cretica TaxID=69181 RepID=A0A8S9Q2H3_BRACR|nr:hypothetical protein F2Q69_00021427 [Brassica cretica]